MALTASKACPSLTTHLLRIMLILKFWESKQAQGARQAAQENKVGESGLEQGLTLYHTLPNKNKNERTNNKPGQFAYALESCLCGPPGQTQCLQLEPCKKRPVTSVSWPKSWCVKQPYLTCLHFLAQLDSGFTCFCPWSRLIS